MQTLLNDIKIYMHLSLFVHKLNLHMKDYTLVLYDEQMTNCLFWNVIIHVYWSLYINGVKTWSLVTHFISWLDLVLRCRNFSNELKYLSAHFAISTLPCSIITALTLLASSKTFRINKGNSISRVPQVHKVSLRYIFHLNFQNVYLNVTEENCMCWHFLQFQVSD